MPSPNATTKGKALLFKGVRTYFLSSIEPILYSLKLSNDFVYIYQPPFNQNSVTTIHPPKQTWNLITSWKRRKIYKQPILGFHVHFWGVCKNKNPTTIAGARLLHMRETTPMTSTAFVSGDCYLLRESTGLETKATAVSGNTVGLVGCYGPWRGRWKTTSDGRLIRNGPMSRWFKVTFSSPRFRSFNPLKGSLNHPKKVTLNHQGLANSMGEFRTQSIPGPLHVWYKFTYNLVNLYGKGTWIPIEVPRDLIAHPTSEDDGSGGTSPPARSVLLLPWNHSQFRWLDPEGDYITFRSQKAPNMLHIWNIYFHLPWKSTIHGPCR